MNLFYKSFYHIFLYKAGNKKQKNEQSVNNRSLAKLITTGIRSFNGKLLLITEYWVINDPT